MKYLLFALLLGCSMGARSQKLSPPAPAYAKKKDTSALAKKQDRDSINVLIEGRLVDLALHGPSYEGSEHQNKINQYQLRNARQFWLNLLTISANYNDQTFKQASAAPGSNNYVYPKYFFGLTIPIGLFFSRTAIKSAKEGVALGKTKQEELARQIKADVLSKYEQYKTYGELIRIQNIVINDAHAAFVQVEEKFKQGLNAIDTYNAANKYYSDELAKGLNLQLQQDLLRLDIERMIGTSLESVLNSFQ